MRAPYVWATWDRLPLITPQIEEQLYPAICAKCLELKCNVVALGGIEDHVHLCVRFPTTLAIATLVKEVKGASSHLVTHRVTPTEFFKWQGAYGAFTVSKGAVKSVCAYIANQKAHHASNNVIEDWERCETEYVEGGD